MTSLIILIVIAATCFLLFELRKLRRGGVPAESAMQELDLLAMSNLLDEHQAIFVRNHVSPSEYRRYERGKNRVLLAYLGLMSAILDSKIRTLTAPAVELAVDHVQLDLFIHARQLVLRAQILLWLSFLFPAGVRLSRSAQEYCRALAESLRNELSVARTSPAS
jgi:hypothetical protein